MSAFGGFTDKCQKQLQPNCFFESGKCKSLLAPLPFLAVGLPRFGASRHVAMSSLASLPRVRRGQRAQVFMLDKPRIWGSWVRIPSGAPSARCVRCLCFGRGRQHQQTDGRRTSMRKLVGYSGAILVLALLIMGFFAYFVRSVDPVTHVWYDGLGRRLSDAPLIARLIFGSERDWAGWTWFLVDMVVFWGGFGIAVLLCQFGFRDADLSKT